MSQVAVIVKGLHWHKNAWKIHKGRWPASRTQLFTFSAAARNAASLFSKQPVVVRSTGLCRCQARTSQGHLLCCLLPQTHRDPTGDPEGSLCRRVCRWGWGFRVALARPVRQHSGDLVLPLVAVSIGKYWPLVCGTCHSGSTGHSKSGFVSVVPFENLLSSPVLLFSTGFSTFLQILLFSVKWRWTPNPHTEPERPLPFPVLIKGETEAQGMMSGVFA